MKKRNIVLAIALGLIAVGTARSQTTTDCTKTSDITMTCTTNQPPAATPPQPSAYDQFRQSMAEARARRQAAAAAQSQAEAACVGGGGTFYEGHCLTQQQYDEKRKQETEWNAERDKADAAKQAEKDARSQKKEYDKETAEANKAAAKAAEKEVKAAKKQAEKDAKDAKKSQQVSVAQ
jgi:hypothetical protein